MNPDCTVSPQEVYQPFCFLSVSLLTKLMVKLWECLVIAVVIYPSVDSLSVTQLRTY